MPEIISLLSSPDLAPSRARATVASKPPRAGPSNLSMSQSFNFDDEDIATFDLTEVNDDIFPDLPRKSLTTKWSKPIASQTVSLLSDDDFTSPQVTTRKAGPGVPTDAPAPKRPRLSPEAAVSPTYQSWSFSKLNSAGQDKENIAGSSRPTSKSKTTHLDDDDNNLTGRSVWEKEKSRPEPARADSKRSFFDDDVDPFASSPPQREKRPASPKKRGLVDQILDEFASSPPKQREISESGKARSRFDDDLEIFSSSARGDVRQQEPKRKAVAWDPISSSAPLQETEKPTHNGLRRVQSEVINIDSDGSLSGSDDDVPDLLDLDLAKIRAMRRTTEPPSRSSNSSSSKARASGAVSKTISKPRAPAAAKKSTFEKALDKEERLAAQKAERERKEREKKRLQEERALEKQKAKALAEVNKIRTDKKVSTPEMIVDLPDSLTVTTKCQAEAMLDRLDVETTTYNSPLPDTIRWRRKVKSKWNPLLERWDPIPPRIEPESYAMVIMIAPEFVKHVLAGTLDDHARQFKSHFPSHTLIYLLEGLTPWLRKNRSLRNRQFTSLVRDEPPAPSQSQSQSQSQSRRRKKTPPLPQEYIDETLIDDALLNLHVLHATLIHHTNAPVETAEWIAIFTQHISTVPYRRQREESNAASAGFCMETGQVRTGDGAKDTYVRMLQEIGRITAPIAYGIAGEFDTVPKLVKGLERGGPFTLEGVRKSANKNGEFSERAVGQSVSRRLHKIFTGRDEFSEDI